MVRRTLCAALTALVTLACAAAEAQDLGSQRVGTSGATFLKIGLGARAVGMGDAFVAVADDPTAIVWNPAGLAYQTRPVVMGSSMRWPTDVTIDHIVAVHPLSNGRGTLAAHAASLRADVNETTEFDPLGTGRTFSYTDFFAGVSYARLFTDRLALGVGARFVHEDLGSAVGGTSGSSVAFDVGSLYRLGWRAMRMGMSVTNFGPPLRPGGQFTSPLDGVDVDYGSYALPTTFKFGIADDIVDGEHVRITGDVELLHPADAVESFRAGAEVMINNLLALRGGYTFTSDLPGGAAGAGFRAGSGNVMTKFDYAYKDGGDLGAAHVLSLTVIF